MALGAVKGAFPHRPVFVKAASPSGGRLFFSAVTWTPARSGSGRFQDTRRTVELEGGGLLAGCGAAQRKKKAAKGDLFPDRFLNATRKAVGQKECSREIKMRFFGRRLCASFFRRPAHAGNSLVRRCGSPES